MNFDVRPEMSMNNLVDHTNVVQLASSKLCTNSESLKPTFHEGQPVTRSHTTEEGNKQAVGSVTSDTQECTPGVVVITASSDEENIKRQNELCGLPTKNHLPGKLVFFKWWLDTMGQNKPLRSAWEDEEQSIPQFYAESHSKSATYVGGQCPSCSSLSNSEDYMDVATLNALASTSWACVSGQVNFIAKTSTRQTVGHKQNLNAKTFMKNCFSARHNHASDNGQRFDEAQSWPTSASRIRHMQDQNASSNVITGHIALHDPIGDSHLDEVNIADNDQAPSLLDIVAKAIKKEERTEWTHKPDIRMSEISASAQNDNHNIELPSISALTSQLNLERCSSSADERVTLKPLTCPTNNYEKNIFPFSEDNKGIQQTSSLKEMSNCVSGAAVACSREQEDTCGHSHCNILFNNETDIKESFLYDHNYVPTNGTLPDCCNASKSNLSHTERTRVKSKKRNIGHELDNACLSGNNNFSPRKILSDSDSYAGRSTSDECEKENNLKHYQGVNMKLPNNDPADADVDTKLGLSYFSRLVEKQIKTNLHLNISHQDTSPSYQISCNGDIHASDQRNIISPSTSQLEETWSSSANTASESSCQSEFTNNQLGTNEQTFSLDPDKAQSLTVLGCKSQTSLDLLGISRALPLNDECGYRYDLPSPVKHATTHSGQAIYPIEQVQSEYSVQQDDYSNQANDDPSANVKMCFNEQMISNQYKMSESTEHRSDSNDQDNNTCSSHNSGENSMSRNISDIDDQKSDSLEWIAGSFSNSSLPLQTSQPKVKVRQAESTTNTKKQKQKEIIDRARLLISMLDKLPMTDKAWDEIFKFEVEKNETSLKSKNLCTISKKDVNCSNIMSALKKYDTYHKKQLCSKLKNERDLQPPTGNPCDKTTSNSENNTPVLSQRSNIVSATPNCSDPMSAVVGANSILKPGKSTSNETLYNLRVNSTKTYDHAGMKSASKLSKDVCLTHHTFSEGNSLHESQKASSKVSAQCLSKNMPVLLESSKSKVTAETVPMHPKSWENKASNAGSGMLNVDKPSSNKILNNCESNINEAHTKSFNKKISNRLRHEQSNKQLEKTFSEVTAENKSENITKYTSLGLQMDSVPRSLFIYHNPKPPPVEASDFSRIHNPRPPPVEASDFSRIHNPRPPPVEASDFSRIHNPRPPPVEASDFSRIHNPRPPPVGTSDFSRIQMLFSLPSLNKREPVYPKPRPNALRDARNEDLIVSCNLPTASVASEPSIACCNRQEWTKAGEKNFKGSANCSINISTSSKSRIVKNTEALQVLPPLQCINSETMNMYHCNMLKSVTIQEQHEKVEAHYSDGTKLAISQLEHPDSASNTKSRPKCVSPDHLRKDYRKTALTSADNPELFLSPLRRKFDRMKYKVSDGLFKLPQSLKFRAHFTSHPMYRSVTTDNAALEQSTAQSLQVSELKNDTYNLPSTLLKGESSNRNRLCNSFEMSSSKLLLNNAVKNSFHSEKDVTKATCQQDILGIVSDRQAVEEVRNEHEAYPICSDSSKDEKICFEGKEISNYAPSSHVKRTSTILLDMQKLSFQKSTDLETCKMSLKNELNYLEPVEPITERIERSETKHLRKLYNKRCKMLARKPRCSCTSSFKFLMLLLSDELGADGD